MSVEQTLLAGIASALTIAGSVAKAANGPRLLLNKLGWDLPPGVEDIGLAGDERETDRGNRQRQGESEVLAYESEMRRTADVKKNPKAFE